MPCANDAHAMNGSLKRCLRVTLVSRCQKLILHNDFSLLCIFSAGGRPSGVDRTQLLLFLGNESVMWQCTWSPPRGNQVWNPGLVCLFTWLAIGILHVDTPAYRISKPSVSVFGARVAASIPLHPSLHPCKFLTLYCGICGTYSL